MSSHHIVKEKQEPALYIHELGSFDEELLGQLLEWSPTVWVASTEYEQLSSMGIKIDAVLGTAPTELQEQLRVLPAPNGNINEALDLLLQEGYPAVNVISRIVHFDEFTTYLPQMDLVLYTDKAKHFAIKTGFSFWKSKGTLLWIDVMAYFEACNLVQLDDNNFEVQEDGMVTFSFSVPYLFIGEYL